ncbi:unnamed protein product [Linum trigynum]
MRSSGRLNFPSAMASDRLPYQASGSSGDSRSKPGRIALGSSMDFAKEAQRKEQRGLSRVRRKSQKAGREREKGKATRPWPEKEARKESSDKQTLSHRRGK